MPSPRGTWWSITINNPTEELRHALQNPPDYAVGLEYQDEIGKETHTLHIQGALHTIQVRHSAIKEWLPGAYIQRARNKDALRNYVCKSETAFEGTYVSWTRPPRNEIVEEVPEIPDTALSLHAIILMLVSVLHEDEYLEDGEDLYKLAVNRIVTLNPLIVEKLTANRVLSTWRIIYLTYIQHWQAILNDFISDKTDSPQPPECLIEEDIYSCLCDRDHCIICNEWAGYFFPGNSIIECPPA